jgi:hypothetical protein
MKPSHLRILFGNRFHTAKSIIDMSMYRWTTWSLSIVIASARALWCLFRAGTVTFWIFWWLDTPLKGWKKILLYISWSVVLKAVLLGYMRFEGCMVHTSVMKLEIAGAGSIFEVESPIGCQQLAVFHHSTVFFGAVLFWPIRMDVSFERRLDLLIHSKNRNQILVTSLDPVSHWVIFGSDAIKIAFLIGFLRAPLAFLICASSHAGPSNKFHNSQSSTIPFFGGHLKTCFLQNGGPCFGLAFLSAPFFQVRVARGVEGGREGPGAKDIARKYSYGTNMVGVFQVLLVFLCSVMLHWKDPGT